jgi:hypothetical protein
MYNIVTGCRGNRILLRNSVEVSVVTNTSVSRNTVTNSTVSYTQRFTKDRYALWMDNRCFPSNQTARGTFLNGLGRRLLLGSIKATLGWTPTPIESVLQFGVLQASQWASRRRRQSAVESKTDSQEAVVNTASEGTVCNRAIVIPTVKSGLKSVKD